MDIIYIFRFCLVGNFKFFRSKGENIVFRRQICGFEARKELGCI